MLDIEDVYTRVPVILQSVLVSAEGWRIQRRRYSKTFYIVLKEYEERDKWDAERLFEYRNQKLRQFIVHCENTVPYYRKLFDKLNFSCEDAQALEDMQLLPILRKETVQKSCSDFLSENIPAKKRSIAHTSGTTGAGLQFATTRKALSEQWAVWWRYRRWHKIPFNISCAYFGGRTVVSINQNTPPFWRINYPGKQILFSGYHMSPNNLKDYIHEFNRQHLEWIHGYPSLIVLLASYMLENNIILDYQPKWITTGAENLLPFHRRIITKAFGIEPRQHYGLAEGVANISECEFGKLHVDEDYAAVEFIPCEQGDGYKIIGTNFTNPATPLIRYETGDIVQLEHTDFKCPCGRNGRIVKSIDGRNEDYIVLKNGSRLGRMDHIFKDMVNIKEAQLYQSTPGKIEIRIVPGQSYTKKDEKELLSQFRKRVGDDTKLSIKYLKNLERSNCGKLRFVVSSISLDSYMPETCCI